MRHIGLLVAGGLLIGAVAHAAPPQVRTVPGDASGVHETYASRSITLKAATSVAGPTAKATWDFGDGSQPVSFAIENAYDLSVSHAYLGATGSLFKATVTVEDTTTKESTTAEYLVRISDKSLALETNIAVDEAVWFLHKSMRADAANLTALNLLALESQGYLASGDAANPYTETVSLALAKVSAAPAASRDAIWYQALALSSSPDVRALLNNSDNNATDTRRRLGLSDRQDLAARLHALSAAGTGRPSAEWTRLEAQLRDQNNLDIPTASLFELTLALRNHSSNGQPNPIRDITSETSGDLNWFSAQAANGDSTDGVARVLLGRQTAQGSIGGSLESTAQAVLILREVGPTSVTNITSQITETHTAWIFNRGLGRYLSTINITNTGGQVISGPLNAGIINLTPGAVITNASGTFNGAPYILFPSVTTLNPGGTASVQIQATLPPSTAVTYGTAFYTGTFPPGALSVTCPTSTATLNAPYNSAMVASGGSQAYLYSFTGSLPNNITLTPGTGALTGTPTVANVFNFTASVLDSAAPTAQSASANCSITVSSSPSLLSASPNTGVQGATNLNVTLTGQFTNWVNGTSTASFGSGITVNSLTVATATSATANITIAPAATPGARNITVTTGAEVVSLTNGFTVNAGTPTLLSVSPNAGPQGATSLSVTLTGQFTNWVNGTSTASFGSGITVNSLTVATATTATANITIDPSATIGPRPVSVTTGAEVVSLLNGFTVNAGTPVITVVNPNSGNQGATNVNVALTGQFTSWAIAGTTANFGPGITVNILNVLSATSANASITISPGATPGPRNVTMTIGAEVATIVNGFTVNAATPIITTVSPNTGQQGATALSVTLTGQFTNWVNGVSTASFGSGITVTALNVASATSATALLNIDPGASIGPRNVTVTTGVEIASISNGFTVTAATPVLLSAAPNSGQQAQTNLNVTLTGQFTNWVNGTSSASFGAGITVNSLTVATATSAVANISIDATAATGVRNITVTTGAEIVTLTNGFAVGAGTPTVLSVSPNTGQQGQTLSNVAITGQFTAWVNGVSSASFGAGITVNSLTVTSATTATANITITVGAATGLRNVRVITGPQNIGLNNGFTVTAGTPAVAAVSPNTGQQGQTLASVALTGQFTNWINGTSTASFGAGITVNSLTVTTATTATANITIDPAAATGPRTVTITTGAEVASLASGFTVTPGTPIVTSVTPNSALQGQTVASVALTGQYTNWVNGTSSASFGAGITVNSLTVLSATTATANITITPGAATGLRTVSVTTGAEVASLANAFTVNPGVAPTITSLAAVTFRPGLAGQTFTVNTTGTPSGAAMVISQTGSLPSGVTFTNNNNGTATIAGTPAAGTQGNVGNPPSLAYPIIITADNTVPTAATQNFALTIACPVITVNGPTPVALVFGLGVFGTYTQLGGSGAITWSATGLPAGVSIVSGTGALTGTPTVTGTFAATITATDAGGCVGTKAVTVTSAPALGPINFGGVGNTQSFVTGASGAPTTPAVVFSSGLLASAAPVGGVTITGASCSSGGTLSSVDGAGRFIFTPNVSATSATCTYSGSSNTGGGAAVSNIANLTFTLTGKVWYVSHGSGGTHDGRSNSPFLDMGGGANNLDCATGTANNDVIYVSQGTASTTGACALKTGQQLLGSGAAATVGILSIPVGTAPTLTGTLSASSATGLTVNGVNMSTGTSPAINFVTSTGNFTFGSITTSGAATAITLTGTSGTFTVNGDGTGRANGSGGTIANATSSALTATTAGGTITLRSMNIILNTSAIQGVFFDNNLGGTLAAALSGISITGVTASGSQNKALLQFETGANANVIANVQNSFFNGSRSYGMAAVNVGSAVVGLTLNQSGFGTDVNTGTAINTPGTTITNAPAIGVLVSNSGNALVDYSITNNTFWGASGSLGAIYGVTFSGSTATGRLSGSYTGNRLGKTGVTGSGCSGLCAGVGLLPGNGGQFKPTLTGNDVRQTNSVGVNFINNVGAGSNAITRLVFKANTVAEPDTTGSPVLQRAIGITPGNSGGANVAACLEIGNNTGTTPANQNNFSGGWQGGNFVRITNNNNTQPIVMPGLSPLSGATGANVNAFVQGANIFGAPATGTDVNSTVGTAGINGSGSSCP